MKAYTYHVQIKNSLLNSKGLAQLIKAYHKVKLTAPKPDFDICELRLISELSSKLLVTTVTANGEKSVLDLSEKEIANTHSVFCSIESEFDYYLFLMEISREYKLNVLLNYCVCEESKVLFEGFQVFYSGSEYFERLYLSLGSE